jgi:hypothetical protein
LDNCLIDGTTQQKELILFPLLVEPHFHTWNLYAYARKSLFAPPRSRLALFLLVCFEYVRRSHFCLLTVHRKKMYEGDSALMVPSSGHAVAVVNDIARKMDMLGFQRERSLQHSQENMLDAAKILRAECDRAQTRCDEARAKARKVRMDLETVGNRKIALEKEVRELESRMEELQKQLHHSIDGPAAPGGESSGAPITNDVHAIVKRAEKRAAASAAGSGSEASGGVDMTHAEYIFLVNRLSVEVDAEESAVTTLRQKHQDAYSRLKSVASDVERLREEQLRLDVHRRALQEQQLVLAASKANPAHREASNTYEHFKKLEKELEAREDALRLARMETSTLVSHLLSGTDQRSQTLNTLRRNLLQRGDSDRSDAHHVHFASDLLAENSRRRADLSAMIVACDEEKDALRQYISVVSQRIEDANRRHFEALKSQR